MKFTPLLVAALLAWILSVCIHEFCHALVAYFGGDKSVRDKGYLTLDPTRFIDPIFSIALPAIILMMGGFPLPGGAVRIDWSLLKSDHWRRYVYAAGPASNFVLYLLFALPLHPALGLVDGGAESQPDWVYFLGAMAFLNFFAMLFNLLPVPPLDGFGIIEHRFSYETQRLLRQNALLAIGALFLLFWTVPAVWIPFWFMIDLVSDTLGFPVDILSEGYNYILFGKLP
ncbi:MAG: site-2 protease family protein [Phycisphaerae bacterium]